MIEKRTVGKPITMKVKIYDKAKYSIDAEKINEIIYDEVSYWEIITDDDVEKLKIKCFQ